MAVDTYTRVNWEDYPSTDTPINASNLNKMDAGVKANNNGIKALETAQGAADISAIGDGTVKGAISTLNNDLTEYCKVINGKLYAYNSTTQDFDLEVKTGMKCVKEGTFGGTASGTIDISDLGFTDTSYFVYVNGFSMNSANAQCRYYATNKTPTSFGFTSTSNRDNGSGYYQILA